MINLSKFLPFFIPNVYRACSFFTNLDRFCIDNARVIYRKIRYKRSGLAVDCQQEMHELGSCVDLRQCFTEFQHWSNVDGYRVADPGAGNSDDTNSLLFFNEKI